MVLELTTDLFAVCFKLNGNSVQRGYIFHEVKSEWTVSSILKLQGHNH
jgi:hypothetical protein